LRKLQTEKDRQITSLEKITTLEKSLADTFHRMELLLERLVGQNNGRDATQDKTESTQEMSDLILSDGLFEEETKQEQLVEIEPTRDTRMNESFLSDGSFFCGGTRTRTA
jgi:hypothetical protein